MAFGYAKNIFDESRPLFFITGLIGLRPPIICSKAFPGYIYVSLILLAYYLIYLLALNDVLALYNAMSAYTKTWKTRLIQMIANFFFVTIMMISSLSIGSRVRKLYVDVYVVDEKLKLLNVRFDYARSMRRELIHVLQVMMTTVMFNLVEYYPEIGPDTPENFFLLWIVNSLPQFVNSFVIASFVITMNKIRRRFEVINELIPNLMIVEKNVISTLESEMNNLFRLRLLNGIHEKLFNAATILVETHGPMLLTSFVVYFLTSCAHLRTVTLHFGEFANFIDFTVESLWTIFYLGKYAYVIHACHSVTCQGKLSERLVVERCANGDHQPVRNETNALARRFESRVLQLTACNFFAIDYPTLKKIVVALAAYVFFVSQFTNQST